MKVFLHLFFPFHWKLHLMIEFFFTKPPSPPPFSQFCPFIFCFFVAIHNCPFPCFCFYSNITFIFPIGNSRFLRYSFFFCSFSLCLLAYILGISQFSFHGKFVNIFEPQKRELYFFSSRGAFSRCS